MSEDEVATLPYDVPRPRRRFPLRPAGAECDAPARTAPPEEEGDGSALACARCGQTITTAVVRTSIGGAHEHTFANPAGFKFHSAASRAPGMGHARPAETYWSWFAGCSWPVEHWRACGEHLRWFFRAEVQLCPGLGRDCVLGVEP